MPNVTIGGWSIGEILTVLGLLVVTLGPLLGLIGKVVWLLSQILTSLNLITVKVNNAEASVADHTQSCDTDRAGKTVEIADVQRRISVLETGAAGT